MEEKWANFFCIFFYSSNQTYILNWVNFFLLLKSMKHYNEYGSGNKTSQYYMREKSESKRQASYNSFRTVLDATRLIIVHLSIDKAKVEEFYFTHDIAAMYQIKNHIVNEFFIL